MRVMIYSEYGAPEVLHIEEREKPVVKEGQLLIRTKATTVNFGDLAARNFKAMTVKDFNMPMLFWVIAKLSFGVSHPRNGVLGSEFS